MRLHLLHEFAHRGNVSGRTPFDPFLIPLRGFLDIRDTVRCVEIACLNPAGRGEFRVFNQFTEQFSVLQLAEIVKSVGQQMSLRVEIDHIPDPRVEPESHYYNAKHSSLVNLGLEPHLLSESLVSSLINIALQYQNRIDPALLAPQVNWREARNERCIRSDRFQQPSFARATVSGNGSHS